ncbi:MAG TPA: hypothetical protein VMR70_06845 [Flavisolibacter sp.]|nr:hypothetical protein [Flavisolibacter sp.]
MKKKIILTAGLFLGLLSQTALFAQTNGLSDVKGTSLFNAGIGLGSYGLSGTGGIPLVASFERGIAQNISAGLQSGFVQRTFGTDWKYTYLFVGARGSYHFNNALKIANPKLDVYGGAGITYRRFSVKYIPFVPNETELYKTSSSGDVILNLHAGARYFFSEKIGGFAELGYGISPLQLGITAKF